MIDWTEKYRPLTIRDIVGNHSQIRKLRSWALDWKKGVPQKKAVVLSGKPGIGKTSAAYAIAHDFKWLPIELNASDARNATAINAIATTGATHQTFSESGEYISTKDGGRKLIIIDEADNLYEKSRKSDTNGKDFGDKDGKKTIVKTVKVTQQPVILIVNDDYQLFKGSGSSLRQDCIHLKMYPAKSSEIIPLLKHICMNENILVDAQVLFSISESCQGDIRSAVRDLQSLCMNKERVTAIDVDVLGRRDRSQQIFDVLRDIFQTKDREVIQHNVQMIQEDPQMLLLWVAENLPRSFTSFTDISSGFKWLSKADLYLGRTYRRSQYGLWSYACDLSTIGVSLSRKDRFQRGRFQFPSWLKQTSKYKHVLSAQQSVIEKIALYHHCSVKKARSFLFPQFKILLSNDEELFLSFIKKLSLTEEEAMILGGKNAKKILTKKIGNEKNNTETTLDNNNNLKNKKREKTSKEKDGTLKQQSLGLY
jgi:replication factor C large subunit